MMILFFTTPVPSRFTAPASMLPCAHAYVVQVWYGPLVLLSHVAFGAVLAVAVMSGARLRRWVAAMRRAPW
jgi:hypothetical protein